MSAKQMKFDADARLSLLRCRADRSCSGCHNGTYRSSRGIAEIFGGPAVTKDGVSVAREVELAHPFENMGAKMVHQVAKKTADVAGDGTTTHGLQRTPFLSRV